MRKNDIIVVFLLVLFLICVTFIYLMIHNFFKTRNLKETRQDFVETSTNFNINFIKNVDENREENYLISPYSVEIALSMLKEGASQSTYDEIEKVSPSRNIPVLNIPNRIQTANALFVKNAYKKTVKTSFTNTLKNKYLSEIIYDDFHSPQVINDWVNTKTNGMIDHLLDDISKDFVLGLANALALDIEWKEPFDCINTKKEEFHGLYENFYVPMMNHTYESNARYIHTEQEEGVILPYKSYDSLGEISSKDDYLEFIGIMPKNDLHEYIQNLTLDQIKRFTNSSKAASHHLWIQLSLPRYTYDYDMKDFKNVLIKMNIQEAFDQDKANFSNIIDPMVERLYISKAIHKTYIDLNEKGTKAAAVTYFGLDKATAIMEKPEIVSIIFDQPFIYMIRDHKTEEILFFGVLYEPIKWTESTRQCIEE